MRYCGVVPLGPRHLQLVVVEEVRDPDPPIRLTASFFEPGSAAELATQLRLWEGELVVALGAPTDPEAGERSCDAMLADLGVAPARPSAELGALVGELSELERFAVEEEGAGTVGEGAYETAPLMETSADGVFCALQNRRLPARRHPLGIQMRIAELEAEEVIDDGGDLWQRRIEELEAAAAGLCAHRYAVGHASWLGGTDGAIVLPGSAPPERFETRGVLSPVERLPLAGS
ncbi:MAG: hypothetical protein M3433_06145 [Actinomycetota bacterium]|nr:hypothetical protein [Actinomycetota bacterium]